MANNAVTAKARAVHGSFLTKNDYVDLIHKPTIPAAVAFLKAKPLYASAFADVDETAIHREQAEELINQNVFGNYLRVARFSSGGKDGIMTFYIRRMECEQLIKAVIAITSGSQEGFLISFPEYASEHFSYDPMRLAKAKTLADAAEALKGTIFYKMLRPMLTSSPPDTDLIVTAVNVCYFKWAFEQIDKCTKGKSREQLKEFFLRKADADNLMMCYRMKSTFGADTASISELLVPYHKRLRPAAIESALKMSDPTAALLELFVKTRVASEQVSDIPEININNTDYRYFRHRLAVSTDETEALYSLMMLFGTESTNLCRIIEGIRYGLPPEEIEKYIII